ncbi:hypothetical protein JRI60_52040 [Archangium violaceum]|uniref:hypothetical protein n=1 Tax=Archangium violaceum TaxID=83451 RepID=UPI0019515363|nr:hypothetical protein [Archangium violaceum]QRN97383.1 hypothetical protein JRI60_52040 [Archangium violaceum]
MAEVDLSHPEKLPLKVFREAVEARLESCSADELRAILRTLSHRVRSSERLAFLESLAHPLRAESAHGTHPQDALLDDITELTQELAGRMENADAWDEDYYDEDTLGPYEEFVAPLTVLFERAREASERGQSQLAREAYQALFSLVQREDDYGRGPRAEHLSQVDLPEARARYLRAVYLTTPPEQRAPVLLEEMRRVRSLLPEEPRPRMREWLDISSEPLPDSEAFLRDWVSLLRQHGDPDADAWLREAIALSQGPRGLRELAFSEPTRHPRAFLDLLAALEREGKPREVLSTAREALDVLPAGLPLRAAVASFLASAATRLKQPDTVCAARWEALVAQPTLPHLLDLRDAHASEPERATVMLRAARHLEGALHEPRRLSGSLVPPSEDAEDDLETPARVDRRLLAHAWLLAHDWEAAHALAAKDSALGWTYGDNPQGTVVPCFLALLSGQPPGKLPRNVARLWQWALETGTQAGDWYSGDGRQDAALQKRLERAYAEALPELLLEPPEQERMLEWCLEVARKRASTIVSRKHRRSYDKAAVLLTACAEVLWLRGEEGRGNVLLAGFREGFRRHRAFQAELDEAVGRSSPRLLK